MRCLYREPRGDSNLHSGKRDTANPLQTAIINLAEFGITVEEQSDTLEVIDTADADTVALISETQDMMTVSSDPTHPNTHRRKKIKTGNK